MAIKAVSELPDPIQPLSDGDYLFASQFDEEQGIFISVKCTLGQLKDYFGGGGNPEPPLISCVGATPLIAFSSGADLIESGATVVMLIDGDALTATLPPGQNGFIEAFISAFGAYAFISFTEDQGYPIFSLNDGIDTEVRFSLTIPFDFSPISEVILDFEDENGTSVVNGDTLSFCLAPAGETDFCAGATDSATLGTCTGGGTLSYFINGTQVWAGLGRDVYKSPLESYGPLELYGLKVTPILPDGSVDMNAPWYDNTEYQRFENLTEDVIRVKVEVVDANAINKQLAPNNPTAVFTNQMGVSTAEFCLAPISCPDGYKRTLPIETSVGTDPDITEIQNGDTVYIPIALTPDGPSITQPFVVNADLTDVDPDFYWYQIGSYIAEQLAAQLAPHGLNAVWTNNNHEFGVTHPAADTIEQAIKFYILDDGNTYPEEQMLRGLVPVYCQIPS